MAALGERLNASIGKTRTTSAPSESGSDIGPNELAIIIDLNAVELLPQLCNLVDRKNAVLESRPKTRTIVSDVGTREELVIWDYDNLESELISTITAILRQERYDPLLESELEREFCRAIKEDAKANIAYRERLNKDEPNSWCYFDTLCDEFISFTPYCSFELTPERSRQIVAMAREFLRVTPPERRRAATGMSPWPIIR